MINPELLDTIESTVRDVFKERVRPTIEGHEMLLIRAYSNIPKGCKITSVDKKECYGNDCRVTFVSNIGFTRVFHMSCKPNNRGTTEYWRMKYERLKERVSDKVMSQLCESK